MRKPHLGSINGTIARRLQQRQQVVISRVERNPLERSLRARASLSAFPSPRKRNTGRLEDWTNLDSLKRRSHLSLCKVRFVGFVSCRWRARPLSRCSCCVACGRPFWLPRLYGRWRQRRLRGSEVGLVSGDKRAAAVQREAGKTPTEKAAESNDVLNARRTGKILST